MELGAAKPAGPRTVNLLELSRSLLASPLALPAILLLAFAVYAPTLNDWFISDDFWLMRASEKTSFGRFVIQAFDFRSTDPVPAFLFYRPLYVVTFRITYELFGMNAVWYHVLNVALHLTAVALVWFIARRLISQPALASAVTLIFALHPAYVETVAWIARGNTLMMTVPYLGSLLLFMKYMDGGRRAQLYYAGSLLLYVAAFMYHPNALSLAPVLPAYTFLIARRPSEALRWRSWLPFLPFVMVSVPWLWIQHWVRDAYGLADAFKIGWHVYGNFGQYLGFSLFPVFQSDWQRLHLPGENLRSAIEFGASFTMIGLGLLLLARRRWPYLGVFAVWWFLASQVINTTGILPPPPPQLYLPGASLAFAFVIAWLWGRDLIEELAPRALPVAAKIAPLVLVLLVLAMVPLDILHQTDGQQRGDENRRFVAQLREAVPSLEPGSRLFVVGAPFNLQVFTDDALDSAVELYYGDIEVRALAFDMIPVVEPQLGPNDRIFQYQP